MYITVNNMNYITKFDWCHCIGIANI